MGVYLWKKGLGLKKSVTPSNKHGLTDFPERTDLFLRLFDQKKIQTYTHWSQGLQTSNHFQSMGKSGDAGLIGYDKAQEQLDKSKAKGRDRCFASVPSLAQLTQELEFRVGGILAASTLRGCVSHALRSHVCLTVAVLRDGAIGGHRIALWSPDIPGSMQHDLPMR